MPRRFCPSLTLEGLNAKLLEFNRYGQTGANFNAAETRIVHGGVVGGPPASITLVHDSIRRGPPSHTIPVKAVLTIDEGTRGWVCAPADSPLISHLLKRYLIDALTPRESIFDYMFDPINISDVDGTGCAGAAGGAGGGGARGGAGGGSDPGPLSITPKTTPNSAGAVTPAAKGEESPPFFFSSSPRKNRKNSRKNSRKNRRKSTRSRHRTKQNRY